MEQMESLQRINRQQRLVEWSRRVEACRGSGLTVVQWCQEHGIAVSTYFSWQRKVFQALKEVQEVTFAEVPVMECKCSAAEDKTASRDCTGKETDFSCCINGWRTERSSGRERKTRCGS